MQAKILEKVAMVTYLILFFKLFLLAKTRLTNGFVPLKRQR